MSGIAVRAGEPGAAPGFFGKIPDKGDFVVRRLTRAFLDPWEAWLHAALEASRCQLGDAWLPAYLTSPIWRFVLSPGLCGDTVIAGVIMPSVDRVGRYFPLVVAAVLPDCVNPAELPAAADDWFERAESLALSVLEESFVFERFDLDVAAIGLPVWTSGDEAAGAAHPAPAGPALRGGRVPVGLAADLARAYPLLVHRLLSVVCRRYSLWWTTGSAELEPSLLYCEGLPPIAGFAAFLDGHWDRWGWTGTPLARRLPVTRYGWPMMSEPAFVLRSAARSDTGKVRRHNEDSYLDRPDLGLWVVADGAGGHSAGDYASKRIVAELDALTPPASAAALMAEVKARLLNVNHELRSEAATRGHNVLIASTVVALLIFGRHYAYLWAGDSRLYLLRDDAFRALTRDHSHVRDLVDRGLLTEEAAVHHPHANIVTRAVGADDALDLEIKQDRLQPGDTLLLCSDGLTKLLPDAEIHGILAGVPVDRAAETLVEVALARGAPDNVTVVLVQFGQIEANPPAAGVPDSSHQEEVTRWQPPKP